MLNLKQSISHDIVTQCNTQSNTLQYMLSRVERQWLRRRPRPAGLQGTSTLGRFHQRRAACGKQFPKLGFAAKGHVAYELSYSMIPGREAGEGEGESAIIMRQPFGQNAAAHTLLHNPSIG